MKDQDLYITKHAFKRAKKRLSWPKKALKRMAQKAFDFGVCISSRELKGTELVLLGEIIFVFESITLLTIYPAKMNNDTWGKSITNANKRSY